MCRTHLCAVLFLPTLSHLNMHGLPSFGMPLLHSRNENQNFFIAAQAITLLIFILHSILFSQANPESAKMNVLHVTNVAQVGPFLQIYGHKDKNLLNSLNENIQAYLPRLIETAPPSTQLDATLTYLVHNPRSNKYFRCTLIDRPQPDRVTVEFIDYGNEFDVLAENVSLWDLFDGV